MEWVEVTARTVEEAKDQALDQLGVDENDAEFEVLEEPKAGLFGRLRAEARVRARVQPTAVRPKIDRGSRRRPRKDGGSGSERPPERDGGPTDADGPERNHAEASDRGGTRPPRPARAPRPGRAPNPEVQRKEHMNEPGNPSGDTGQVGEEFLSGLVGAFGLSGTVAIRELEDGDTVELAVEGDNVGILIGPRGQTLAAIQELTRTVVQRRVEDQQTRIVVDVGGYRKARREALEHFTRGIAAEVAETGAVRVLEPMPAADRKVIHDTVNGIEGVSTASEGEEPRRRVVITPDGAQD